MYVDYNKLSENVKWSSKVNMFACRSLPWSDRRRQLALLAFCASSIKCFDPYRATSHLHAKDFILAPPYSKHTCYSFFFYLQVLLCIWCSEYNFSGPSANLCVKGALIPQADTSQARTIGSLQLKCTRTWYDNSNSLKAFVSFFPHVHCVDLCNKQYNRVQVFGKL